MKHYALTITLLFSGVVHSQTPWLWANNIDASYHLKMHGDIAGNLYRQGDSSYVYKFDRTGTQLFKLRVPEGLHSFSSDSQQNLYLCGTFFGQQTYNNTQVGAAQLMNFYMMKLSPAGALLYLKITTLATTEEIYIGDLQINKSDELYLTGISLNLHIGNFTLKQPHSSFFLVRMNTNAEPVWGISDTLIAYGSDIRFDTDGNIFTLGRVPSPMYAPTCLAKFSAAGKRLAGPVITGHGKTRILGMEVDHHGNTFIHQDVGAQYGLSPQLRKFDPVLQPAWTKGLGYSYSEVCFAGGMGMDDKGDLYIGGRIGGQYGNDTAIVGMHIFVPNFSKKSMLLKMGGDTGNVISLRTISTKSSHEIMQTHSDRHGDIYVTGIYNFTSTATDSSGYPAMFDNISIKPSGSISYFVAKLQCSQVKNYLSVTDENINAIDIFPNPARDYIIINSTAQKSALVKIFSITGELQQESVSGENEKVPLNLPPGIYFVQICSGNSMANTKMVVQ